jgi:hypothetical protein
MDTCLHEKGKAKAVEASPLDQPAMWLGELPPRPSRWSSPTVLQILPYRWKLEHTPHFGDSTFKAPIFSVVARHSLVGRVAGL